MVLTQPVVSRVWVPGVGSGTPGWNGLGDQDDGGRHGVTAFNLFSLVSRRGALERDESLAGEAFLSRDRVSGAGTSQAGRSQAELGNEVQLCDLASR